MEGKIIGLIKADPLRWSALECVERLGIPTACIGAGFVRNLVWDHLHERDNDCRDSDLDVLWFDREQTDAELDLSLERKLSALAPDFDWSVKNQARMHTRNGDRPYTSVYDAMKFWPETATAIAVRKQGETCSLIAPFGLSDLAQLLLRPTSSSPRKLRVFEARLKTKDWTARWPKLSLQSARML